VILRDYQEEAVAAVAAELRDGGRRMLVCLPTGAGKTAVLGELAVRWDGPVRVLSHLHALTTQTRVALEAQLQEAVGRWEAALSQTTRVTVVSVPTAVRRPPPVPERPTLYLYDEAHHATARGARRLLATLRPDDALVGVTATPCRGDGVALGTVFDRIVYRRAIRELVERGWLVDVAGYRVPTGVDLRSLPARDGDYAPAALAAALDAARPRDVLAADALCRYGRLGRPAALFAADRAHAERLRDACDEGGVPCALVLGDRRDRDAELAAFVGGHVSAVASCACLLEGWDHPPLETLVLARPTRSPLLAAQMLGRGLRPAPGKERLVAVDLVDLSSGGVDLPTVLGLPPGLDLQGRPAAEAVAAVEEVLLRNPLADMRDVRLDEVAGRVTSFDLAALEAKPPRGAGLRWVATSAGGWFLRLFAGQDEAGRLRASGERLELAEDLLGRWAVRLRRRRTTEEVAEHATLRDAVLAAEGWVATHRPDTRAIQRRHAPWTRLEPTPGQRQLLASLGASATPETRGQASTAIDLLQEADG